MCIFMAAGAAAAGAAGTATAGIGSALGMVMGVAQMGIGIMQAQQQQEAAMQQYQEQVRYRNQQAEENQKTLLQQTANQSDAHNSQIAQAQGEKAEASIEGYAAESRASAAAAESGIVGLSVKNLMADIRGKEGRFQSKIDYNSKVAYHNNMGELKMAQRGAQARFHEIPIPQKPSSGPFMLQAASSIVSGVGTMYKYSKSG